MPEQLFLDLPHRESWGRESFLVAPCNEAAVALVDVWPDWPSLAVALCGPTGCGKSHLADVWRAKSVARRLNHAALTEPDLDLIVNAAPALLLEDIDTLTGEFEERGLYHLLNLVLDTKTPIMMTASQPLNMVKIDLKDARSRLQAVTQIKIEEPDDMVLAGVFMKRFADRQIAVAPDVIQFLTLRIERRFDAVHAAVEILDKAALSAKRKLTIPFVTETLFSESI